MYLKELLNPKVSMNLNDFAMMDHQIEVGMVMHGRELSQELQLWDDCFLKYRKIN